MENGDYTKLWQTQPETTTLLQQFIKQKVYRFWAEGEPNVGTVQMNAQCTVVFWVKRYKKRVKTPPKKKPNFDDFRPFKCFTRQPYQACDAYGCEGIRGGSGGGGYEG